MEQIGEELKEDMHKIEEDSKKNRLLRYIRFNRSLYKMFYWQYKELFENKNITT